MIPIGPLAAVVYALIRAAANLETTKKPASKTVIPSAVKAKPNPGSDSPAVRQILLLSLLIGTLYAFSHQRPWLGLTLLSIGILLLINPWWTTRNVFVPLRLHRAAFHWVSVGAASSKPDKQNDSVLAAAWCLSRKGSPSSAIAWTETRLPKWRKLRASTVAAHAMLAAARGHFNEARVLFRSVALFHPTIVSKDIARICFEWLATDSAARGDWIAVQHFCKHHRAPRVPTLILLNDAAKRPRKFRVPAAIEVWVARLGIRRPDSLNPNQIFLHQNSPDNLTPANVGGVAAALCASMQTVHDAGQLAALAEHWQKVLGDESLRHQLSQRAAAVGGGNPEATLNSLHRLVESDLVARMDAMTEFSATDAPRAPLLNSALDARRNRLLLEIQDHIERLRVRQYQNQVASTLDEWRNFVAVHRAYSNVCAAGSKRDRTLVFSMVGLPLNSFAVWLYRVRQENAVANAIFRFLETEARLTSSPSYDVIRRNAALGP